MRISKRTREMSKSLDAAQDIQHIIRTMLNSSEAMRFYVGLCDRAQKQPQGMELQQFQLNSLFPIAMELFRNL
jgi:hypothetical protein